MEETLLDVMYEVPSRDEVAQVVVTADVVNHQAAPGYVSRAKIAPRTEKSA